MSDIWEDKFTLWSKPPTNTEEQRSSNAISLIENAIRQNTNLSRRNIRVVVHDVGWQ